MEHIEQQSINYWNKCGFCLCTDGSAEAVINEQFFRLTRGYVFVITPLVQISEFSSSDGYREISFIDDLKHYYPVFRIIADTYIPLNVGRHPCWKLSDDTFSYIVGQSERMRAVRSRRDASTSPEEQRLLNRRLLLLQQETMLEVVCNHIRCYPAGNYVGARRDSVAYHFLLSLHENFHRERTVARYASDAGLSAGHFAALVRDATGKTPSQWISTLTTAYAKMLLERGEKSIKEIAQELNFPEQFTFRKYFKQHAGVSPKDYRLRHSSGAVATEFRKSGK